MRRTRMKKRILVIASIAVLVAATTRTAMLAITKILFFILVLLIKLVNQTCQSVLASLSFQTDRQDCLFYAIPRFRRAALCVPTVIRHISRGRRKDSVYLCKVL